MAFAVKGQGFRTVELPNLIAALAKFGKELALGVKNLDRKSVV